MRLRTGSSFRFRPLAFDKNSVVDRPRPEFWGDIFDRVASAARPHGDLVELDMVEADDAYSAVNAIIMQEARKLAGVNEHGWSRETL
jgi:hypothetical protein